MAACAPAVRRSRACPEERLRPSGRHGHEYDWPNCLRQMEGVADHFVFVEYLLEAHGSFATSYSF